MVEPAGAPATMAASWPTWPGVTSMMAPAGGGSGPQGLPVCAARGRGQERGREHRRQGAGHGYGTERVQRERSPDSKPSRKTVPGSHGGRSTPCTTLSG